MFGIPGEGPSLDLISELEGLGCTFYLAPHEAAAALMAGGYGRVRGVPGISLSIKGPGFSNMLSGIASNWLDRNPTLSISESYGPGSSPHRVHKRMAHKAMVKPVVKAYADNVSPELVPDLWSLSLAEEPGPVHLDISGQMRNMTCDVKRVEVAVSHSIPLTVADAIQSAKRPIVIVGALATRRSWGARLASLKIPVFTTVAGKGAVDEILPHAAGVFTNSGGPLTPECKLVPMADLIVGLGLRTSEIIEVKSLPAPLILVDELKSRGDGLGADAEIAVAEGAFDQAIDLLQLKEWGISEVASANGELAKSLSLQHWLPAAAFRCVQALLPDSTLFFLDTGNFCVIGEHALIARRPLQVTGSPQGRSMGVALPASIGAALGRPGVPVVVANGDGGIRMYPETISLAVQERLPLLVLLMSDGFFSSVRQSAVRKGLSETLVRLNSSCWSSVFEALGCPAKHIDSLDDLGSAVSTWREAPGPLFLELKFDPQAYLAMTEGIR